MEGGGRSARLVCSLPCWHLKKQPLNTIMYFIIIWAYEILRLTIVRVRRARRNGANCHAAESRIGRDRFTLTIVYKRYLFP